MPTTLPSSRNTETQPELVLLTGGLAVPRPAWQVLQDLEARGCSISLHADTILVTPASGLHPGDRQVIQRYRPAVIAIINFVAAAVRH